MKEIERPKSADQALLKLIAKCNFPANELTIAQLEVIINARKQLDIE